MTGDGDAQKTGHRVGLLAAEGEETIDPNQALIPRRAYEEQWAQKSGFLPAISPCG